MKLIFMIICSMLNVTTDNLDQIRSDFHLLSDKDSVQEFIENYQHSAILQSKPYVAAAIMRQAEFSFFPHKKLKYFKQGKNKLEQYIESHPHCIEGRYVRLLVQSEIPSILGYKKNIASDKQYILANISKIDLPADYQELIIKNINKID